jgi:hypothetical protein
MIKFPKYDSIFSSITAYCDLCGDVVYSTTTTSTNTEEENTWNQKHPHISKTYKIYCERCYMVPLLKIKELVSLLEDQVENNKKKIKRVKTRVEREKHRLDEINNEFY